MNILAAKALVKNYRDEQLAKDLSVDQWHQAKLGIAADLIVFLAEREIFRMTCEARATMEVARHEIDDGTVAAD